jgi:hypothetical protein
MVVQKSRSRTSKTSQNDTKNIYKSNRKYSDRNLKSFEFPEFDIKIVKLSSVILLLECNEIDVVQKVCCEFMIRERERENVNVYGFFRR